MAARGHPSSARPSAEVLDAFDLPAWVGEEPVTWTALDSVGDTHRVTGELRGAGGALECDLLATDLAYPQPVLDDTLRHDVHQAWELGQVLVLAYDGRMTLAVPGSRVDADNTLEAVRRLAKAVGAPARQFTVALRL